MRKPNIPNQAGKNTCGEPTQQRGAAQLAYVLRMAAEAIGERARNTKAENAPQDHVPEHHGAQFPSAGGRERSRRQNSGSGIETNNEQFCAGRLHECTRGGKLPGN
jgi:hypothetical protein